MKRMEEKKQVNLEVFEWFQTRVLDSKLEPSVGHEELVSGSDVILLVLLVHFSDLLIVCLVCY